MEVRPIRGFRSFDGFEVAELRLSCYVVGVGGLGFLGFPGGFREFLPECGQERGPPGFGPWGRTRSRRSGFNRRCERGEGGGEPLVKLVRGLGLGGGRDEPIFKLICQAWPVSFLPAWPGFVVVGRGGV